MALIIFLCLLLRGLAAHEEGARVGPVVGVGVAWAWGWVGVHVGGWVGECASARQRPLRKSRKEATPEVYALSLRLFSLLFRDALDQCKQCECLG